MPSRRDQWSRCRTWISWLTVYETQSARFFTKLDLAMANMQFRIREEDQYKTSFSVPGGQY